MVLDADQFHMTREKDALAVLFHGNVDFLYRDTRIHANSVVLWYNDSQPTSLFSALMGESFKYDFQLNGEDETHLGPLFSPMNGKADSSFELPSNPVELYAEGNVRLYVKGDGDDKNTLFKGKDLRLYCDKLYTNLKERRGLLLKGEVFSSFEHPIHFKCETLRQICNQLYVMEKVQLTTCAFGTPHYQVEVERTQLKGDFSSGLLSVEDASFSIRGVTVPLPLPDATVGLGEAWYFPIKRIRMGSSSRFGANLRITFKENNLNNEIQKLGQSLHHKLGTDKPFDSDFTFDLDLLSKRGVGYGPELRYFSPELYDGYLKGYYINDSAKKDRGDYPITNNNRGRIRTQNRIHLDEDLLLDLELSYVTDRHFMDEYFEREHKTDKEQETYIYLHETDGSQAMSLLNSYRLNDYQSQIEYLPQGIWDISSIPIAGQPQGFESFGIFETLGLFYSHRTEFSQVRNRPDIDTPDPSERLFRGDYLSVFEAPLKVGIMTMTPFYENRLSFFERTVGQSSVRGRYAESYGFRSGFLFHATSDYQNDLLNLDGIRNILEPAVEYKDTFAINQEAHELIQFDEIEEPVRGDVVNLSLRQRLQTRDETSETGIHTLYDGVLTLPLYPDERLSQDRHRKGDLRFDMIFTPLIKSRELRTIMINEEGRFDLDKKRFNVINSTIFINPDNDYSFLAWHRWVRQRYDYIGTGIRRLLTPKWEVEVDFQYNLKGRTWAERSLIFRRRAHQWIFEFRAKVDKGDDDKSLTVAFTPLFLTSKRNKGSIYDPMAGE